MIIFSSDPYCKQKSAEHALIYINIISLRVVLPLNGGSLDLESLAVMDLRQTVRSAANSCGEQSAQLYSKPDLHFSLPPKLSPIQKTGGKFRAR